MKISAYIAASLDNFIARSDGDVDWLNGTNPEADDPEEDYGFEAFFSSVDAIVMGRKSFEKVLSFDQWYYDETPIFVLSRSTVTIPEKLQSQVTATSLSPDKLVASLNQQGFEHLYIDGGLTIQSFLQAGLIDELTITRIPCLLGQGIPLFGYLTEEIPLLHQQTCSYPSGLVQSRYRVVKTSLD